MGKEALWTPVVTSGLSKHLSVLYNSILVLTGGMCLRKELAIT